MSQNAPENAPATKWCYGDHGYTPVSVNENFSEREREMFKGNVRPV